MKIDHIAIAVNDVEESAKVYQQALGTDHVEFETVESEGVKVAIIELENGSKIKAGATGTTSKDAARSEALSLLIVDEAAFIKAMDTIWVAAQPTLSTGGDCIVLSSPNGIGNWFHKSFIEAEAGSSEQVGSKNISFRPISLPWNFHPDRDDEWARNEKRKIVQRKII